MGRNDDPTLARIEDAAGALTTIRGCSRVLLARLAPHLNDDDLFEFQQLIDASWKTTDLLAELRPLARWVPAEVWEH